MPMTLPPAIERWLNRRVRTTRGIVLLFHSLHSRYEEEVYRSEASIQSDGRLSRNSIWADNPADLFDLHLANPARRCRRRHHPAELVRCPDAIAHHSRRGASPSVRLTTRSQVRTRSSRLPVDALVRQV